MRRTTAQVLGVVSSLTLGAIYAASAVPARRLRRVNADMNISPFRPTVSASNAGCFRGHAATNLDTGFTTRKANEAGAIAAARFDGFVR